MTSSREDENYEKPSTHKLWNERSSRPIATRPMMKSEIEDYRRVLVNSYQCDDNDITFDFQKITDENDEDRDDCIWLKYKMKYIEKGKPSYREIFNIKLPIPDEIRKMAEDLRRQRAGHPSYAPRHSVRRPPLAIESGPSADPAPEIAAPQAVSLQDQREATSEPPAGARQYPKLNKPTRPRGRAVQ